MHYTTTPRFEVLIDGEVVFANQVRMHAEKVFTQATIAEHDTTVVMNKVGRNRQSNTIVARIGHVGVPCVDGRTVVGR